jgi:glucosylceramidase
MNCIDRFSSICSVALVLALLAGACTRSEPDAAAPGRKADVDVWVTRGDQTALLQQTAGLTFSAEGTGMPAIEIDTTHRLQSIDGFGFSLTGGSAMLIHRLAEARQDSLLRELFLTDGRNIGISYLRISLGASDLDDHVFSYADQPRGKSDRALSGFSLKEDRLHLIPVLKKIVALVPDIKIMASPWSAPAWMKTNESPKGGSLRPEYYAVYADYFVKYLQGMQQEGIPIDAVTLQNEPENPKNNPSMLMTASEQAAFVKDHLGPKLEQAGLKTRIVVFDHNCDHPEYAIAVMNDAGAKRFVDGAAFHLYLGEIGAMSKVHDAHPDRNLYFTEQWTSPEGTFEGDLRWHTRHLIVGATRNWSRNVLEWNLAADPQFNPHTDEGGCTMCQGALTIGNTITRNVSYYIIAHASKWVRPGAVRIASSELADLPNVAFVTPAGEKVLIVVNDSNEEKKFLIRAGTRSALATLSKGSVATYLWR